MGQAASINDTVQAGPIDGIPASRQSLSITEVEENEDPLWMEQAYGMPGYGPSDIIQMGQAVSAKTSFDAERPNSISQTRIPETQEKNNYPHQMKQTGGMPRRGPSNIRRRGQAVSAKTSYDAEMRMSQMKLSEKTEEEEEEQNDPLLTKQSVQLPEYVLSDIIQQGQAVSSKTSYDVETRPRKIKIYGTKQTDGMPRRGPSNIRRRGQAVSAKTSYDAEMSQMKPEKTEEEEEEEQNDPLLQLPEYDLSDIIQQGQAVSSKTSYDVETRPRLIKISDTKEKNSYPHRTKQIVEMPRYGPSDIIQMGQAVSAKTSFDAERRPNSISQIRIPEKTKEEQNDPLLTEQTEPLPEYVLSDIIQQGQAVSSKTSYDVETRPRKIKISKKTDYPHQTKQLVELPRQGPSAIQMEQTIQMGQAVSAKTSFDAERRHNGMRKQRINTRHYMVTSPSLRTKRDIMKDTDEEQYSDTVFY